MPTLKDMLVALTNREVEKDALIDALAGREFECGDARVSSAVNRLALFYRAEVSLQKYHEPRRNVFQDMLDELLDKHEMTRVSPVTVLCREPEGELGEMHMYEVAPKSIDLANPEAPWNKAVVQFMWNMTAKQSYGLFLLSHAPITRAPPYKERIASMTPAQIEAKQRAVRLFLTSAFVNKPERLARLSKQLGVSPWKNIMERTQMFGLKQGTVGYVHGVLNVTGNGFEIASMERKIIAMTDIVWPAMARAALYLNADTECMLVLQKAEAQKAEAQKADEEPVVAVFIVCKTLFTISDNGDVFYNLCPDKKP